MNISFLFLWILISVAFVSAIDDIKAQNENESPIAPKKVDEAYNVDQPQQDRENVEPFKQNVAVLKVKDDLILSLHNAVLSKDSHIKDLKQFKDALILSKDSHIKDLQNRISELQNINNIIKKEINELKTFVREELSTALSKIDTNGSKLRLCEDQLKKINITIAENAAKLKSKELKGARNVVREYEDQLEIQNKTLAENDASISQLTSQVKSMTTVKEHARNEEGNQTSCHTYFKSNGIFNLTVPETSETFAALLNNDIAGPGWIVIQQRINGKENFERNWKAYKNGFGNFTGDFFLGLEKIYRLTNAIPHELYIHMERFTNTTFYARYDNFSIAGEDDKYRLLSLGSFSGTTPTDNMRISVNAQFSTFDRDNDDNCVKYQRAAFWHNTCAFCNLNGIYFPHQAIDKVSNYWEYPYSLKTIKMLIRPLCK